MRIVHKANSVQIYNSTIKQNLLYIYFTCLSVRLYTINVKSADPIGPYFFVATHMTKGKVWTVKDETFCLETSLNLLYFTMFKDKREYTRNYKEIDTRDYSHYYSIFTCK